LGGRRRRPSYPRSRRGNREADSVARRPWSRRDRGRALVRDDRTASAGATGRRGAGGCGGADSDPAGSGGRRHRRAGLPLVRRRARVAGDRARASPRRDDRPALESLGRGEPARRSDVRSAPAFSVGPGSRSRPRRSSAASSSDRSRRRASIGLALSCGRSSWRSRHAIVGRHLVRRRPGRPTRSGRPVLGDEESAGGVLELPYRTHAYRANSL